MPHLLYPSHSDSSLYCLWWHNNGTQQSCIHCATLYTPMSLLYFSPKFTFLSLLLLFTSMYRLLNSTLDTFIIQPLNTSFFGLVLFTPISCFTYLSSSSSSFFHDFIVYFVSLAVLCYFPFSLLNWCHCLFSPFYIFIFFSFFFSFIFCHCPFSSFFLCFSHFF